MTDYYFSATGDDSNDGLSEDSPKQSYTELLSVYRFNAVGGDSLLLKGGDSFATDNSFWINDDDNRANPIIVDSYGTGIATLTLAAPNLRGIIFKDSASFPNRGGLLVRNIGITGDSAAGSIAGGVSPPFTNFVFDNVLINGTHLGMSPNQTGGVANVQIINSQIINCPGGAIGGSCDDYIVDNNYIDNCGFNNAVFDHSIYITGSKTGTPNVGLTITNNTIKNNCNYQGNGSQSVALVVHGEVSNILIESNYFKEPFNTTQSTGYAIEVGVGYAPTYEFFSDVTIRRNTCDGTGYNGINVNTADPVLIEENILVNTVTLDGGRIIGVNVGAGGDDTNPITNNVVVKNNVTYGINRVGDDIQGAVIDVAVPIQTVGNDVLVKFDAPLNCQLMSLPAKGAITALGVDGSFTYEHDGVATLPTTDTLTYKINDSNGESNTATATFNIESAIQTLHFNGVDSYGSFSEVVLITDWECEFIFSRPDASVNNEVIMCRSLTDGTAKVQLKSTGEIIFSNQSNQQVQSSGAGMTVDDQEYYIKAVCTAGVLEIFTAAVTIPDELPTLVSRGSGASIYNFRTSVIGAGSNNFVNCSIKNLKFTNGSGDVVAWGIDSGSTTTETPTMDTLGIGDITFNNEDGSGWS